MQFTGSELTLKRNFYTQTGNFGFGVSCNVDNTSGTYYFGVSGNQGNLEFKLESGKIYYQNQYIHSYIPFREFVIEASFSTGHTNIIKDETALVYGDPKETGNYDYFYFKRENNSLNAEFDLYVSGNNTPVYQIQEKGYLFTSGQNAVTGYFFNNGGFPINVFDSNINSDVSYNFGKLSSNISANGSGFFAFTGNFNEIDFSSPIITTFNTNFNDIEILFSIIDVSTLNKFVLFDDIDSFDFGPDSTLNRTLSYTNYSGGFITDSFNTQIQFILEYVSGSGNFSTNNFVNDIPYNTTLYGNFQESGLLTGQYSVLTGNQNITGDYIIDFSEFSWATGLATGFFSGIGTGIATGNGYTGLAVGSFTGLHTGIINNGSGIFYFNPVIVTGYGLDGLSLDYPNYINATGFINISNMSYGDVVYIGSLTSPLEKGLQFINETGLVYYLSGAPEHQVLGYYDDGVVKLTAQLSGLAGNGIPIQPYNCNFYPFEYTPFLTGAQDVGITGDVVYPIGPYTGNLSFVITGSGLYQKSINGTGNGEFFYTKTYTGSWDILTGFTQTGLRSLKTNGSFNENTISGSGLLPPNSSIIFSIIHSGDGLTADIANLIITGDLVLNPINQQIFN